MYDLSAILLPFPDVFKVRVLRSKFPHVTKHVGCDGGYRGAGPCRCAAGGRYEPDGC